MGGTTLELGTKIGIPSSDGPYVIPTPAEGGEESRTTAKAKPETMD